MNNEFTTEVLRLLEDKSKKPAELSVRYTMRFIRLSFTPRSSALYGQLRQAGTLVLTGIVLLALPALVFVAPQALSLSGNSLTAGLLAFIPAIMLIGLGVWKRMKTIARSGGKPASILIDVGNSTLRSGQRTVSFARIVYLQLKEISRKSEVDGTDALYYGLKLKAIREQGQESSPDTMLMSALSLDRQSWIETGEYLKALLSLLTGKPVPFRVDTQNESESEEVAAFLQSADAAAVRLFEQRQSKVRPTATKSGSDKPVGESSDIPADEVPAFF